MLASSTPENMMIAINRSMAGFIKEKVAKKLAVYFKNMSADGFNLPLTKGEGRLTNLGMNAAITR